MMNVEKIADFFAERSFDIEGIYRLVIQPKSVLREFKTEKHGFLFTVSGEATMRVNGTTYNLHPGSVFHAAPNMVMDSQVIGDAAFEYYSLFYRFDKQGDALDLIGDQHYTLEAGFNPSVTEALMMIHRQAAIRESITRLRVKQLFLGILHHVLMASKHRDQEDSPRRRVADEAASYIHEHFMHPLTLDGLAELHGMNANSFSYYFHKYKGIRPIDYLVDYRMERARELLQTGHYSIRDIAASVGYGNPLYFSRLFKKKFGVAPTAYRDGQD